MGKSPTTYLQAKYFRALWTIAGILSLALMMTPKFYPAAQTTEISQTVVDKKPAPTAPLKRPQNTFWTRVQKILQARTNPQQARVTANKL